MGYRTPETASYLAGKFWDVQEEVWTGMLRGDLNHEISDTVTLRGNVGVQFIHTDQSSGSFRVDTKGTNDGGDLGRGAGTHDRQRAAVVAAAPVGQIGGGVSGGSEDLRFANGGLEPRLQGCAFVRHGPR